MAAPSSGAGVLARLLSQVGVTATSGLLDDSFADLADELAALGIEHVAPRSEASAVQLAAARAHVTGTVGGVLLSGIRGVLQALPALADAQAAGQRLVVVSTTRRGDLTGPARSGVADAADATAVTGPLVTWAAHVPSLDRLPELLARAQRHVWARPGVVHLQVPESELAGTVREHVASDRAAAPGPADGEPPWRTQAAPADVEEIAGRLVRAQRPVLHCGRGVLHSGAEQQVRDLVTMLDAAVTTTFGARGVVPEDDRHVVAPVHPVVVDDVRTDADVVLVVGADLGESDWWGAQPNWGSPRDQYVAQVDVDPRALGRNRPVDLPVVGDARSVLGQVVEAVRALGERDTTPRLHWLEDQRAAMRRSRARINQPLTEPGAGAIHPAQVVVAARLALPESASWVLDGHHTRRWGQFHLPALRSRGVLGTGPLPMDGGAIATAIGVALARPEEPVGCLVGDGSLGRQLAELATAVELDLPVLVMAMIDDDGAAARRGHARPRAGTARPGTGTADPEGDRGPDGGTGGDAAPDETGRAAAAGIRDRIVEATTRTDQVRFDLVARALGAWGEFVDDPEHLRAAIDRAVASGRAALVHVVVDHVDHAWSPEAGMFRAQRTGRRAMVVDDLDEDDDRDEADGPA